MGQINGGQGIFSGNLKATGDTKSTTSSEEVHVLYTRSGGSGSPLVIDLDGLRTAIHNLKQDAQKAAAFRKITLSSYDQVLDRVGSPEKERDFRVIAEKLGRFRTLRDYARQANLEPYLFIMDRNVTRPILKEIEIKLAAHVTGLESAARECIEKARCDIRKQDDVSDLDYWISMPVPRGSFRLDNTFSARADTKRANEQSLSSKRLELSFGSLSESQKASALEPYLKQVSDDQDQLEALDRQYVPALVNHLMMSNIKLPNERRCGVPGSRCLTAADIDKLQERLEKQIIEIEKSRPK
ncbi:MAG: hypothetical protein NTV70_12070 [Acidobacteria bacterium]|nr:hypothetical protein [Acidobacteriota bacterium]